MNHYEHRCNLCLNNSYISKHYAYYVRTTKDINKDRCVTNLTICDTCLNKIKDDIEILSNDINLSEIPFKLKHGKHLWYYEYNLYKSRF